MKQFNFSVLLTLARATDALRTPPSMAENEIDADVRRTAREVFAECRPHCIEVGLTLSTMTIDSVMVVLDKPNSTFGEYHLLLLELQGRLRDEAVAMRFFQISVGEAEYYSRWFEGWEEVLARFPDTTSDVEEASKCFALARYAAAVFHSTQVMEMGLIELGRFIGVNDPKPGWTSVTGELAKILGTNFTELPPKFQQSHTFLEQVYGTATAVKNAWRNKIDHASERLKLFPADFTPEIAEEILFASRAFMRRLAEELPTTDAGKE